MKYLFILTLIVNMAFAQNAKHSNEVERSYLIKLVKNDESYNEIISISQPKLEFRYITLNGSSKVSSIILTFKYESCKELKKVRYEDLTEQNQNGSTSLIFYAIGGDCDGREQIRTYKVPLPEDYFSEESLVIQNPIAINDPIRSYSRSE